MELNELTEDQRKNAALRLIAQLDSGSIARDLAEKLQAAAAAAHETGKEGWVAIKIKIKPKSAGKCKVDGIVTAHQPVPDRIATPMFLTQDGQVLREHPDQKQLDLKVTERSQEEFREAAKPAAQPKEVKKKSAAAE